jgi:hypothetical protein
MVQFEDDRRERGSWFARGERIERERFAGIRRFFGQRYEALVGILVLFFSLAIAGIVIKDAILSSARDKSGLKRIVATRWNDRTLAFPIEGRDHAGRQALFDVVVLTKNYGWVRGSTTELERGDVRLTPADIENEVLAPQLRQGLASAQELIAVGLASVEGNVAREEQRGGLRALRIAEWVRNAVGPSMPMMTLNLGRYIELCSDCETDDTSWQRPFIVIAIKRRDPGTDLGEALRDAMSDKLNLPSPDRYSAFALARYSK